MRQILFRGKRADNGEWVEGFYTLYANNRGLHPCILTGTEQGCVIPAFIIPETLGQFTGLHDENGRRIFEGDIVKDFIPFNFTLNGKKQYKENAYVVEYCEQICGFEPFCLEGYDGIPIIERCKIVGNIHDNSDLLAAENHGRVRKED